MPRATDHSTPSRRALLGGAAIGLLAAAPVAALATVPGANPDADLMAACTDFHAAADAEQAACGGKEGLPPGLSEAVYACLNEVNERTPTTIEGVRAKAGVLHRMLRSRDVYKDAEDPRSRVSDLHMAALNFLRDLSGEG